MIKASDLQPFAPSGWKVEHTSKPELFFLEWPGQGAVTINVKTRSIGLGWYSSSMVHVPAAKGRRYKHIIINHAAALLRGGNNHAE